MWFKKLTGFIEISPDNVRKNMHVDGINITSNVNGNSYQFGTFELISLQSLKLKLPNLSSYNDNIKICEVIADIQKLHCDINNYNALFQAASQFNLLEMVGPHINPEAGIDIYEYDHTQGPACAIACGAGTIFRNYFVSINGKTGQSKYDQIDCLKEIGKFFNNENCHLWKMSNGYALLDDTGLGNITSQINSMTFEEREYLKGLLNIGLQWNTQVTLSEKFQVVNQAYCSALPVAYSNIDSTYFESFARLILEATYEATLYAAMINLQKNGCNKVYLTLVGGGAFGNKLQWITDSLMMAVRKFKNTPLDIKIVSYNRSNLKLKEIIDNFNI